MIGVTTGQVAEMAIGAKGAGSLAKATKFAKTAKQISNAEKVGSTLLSTLSRDDEGRMWIRTSHLPAGNNIDTDAFGSMFDEVAVAEEVEAEA